MQLFVAKDKQSIVFTLNMTLEQTRMKNQKLFVDARSERMGENTTLEEYKNVLIQKGIEQLANYRIEENVNFGLDTNSYEYKVDFDLGDKVDVIISEINLVMTARIKNVYEVIKSGYRTLELEVDNLKIM